MQTDFALADSHTWDHKGRKNYKRVSRLQKHHLREYVLQIEMQKCFGGRFWGHRKTFVSDLSQRVWLPKV